MTARALAFRAAGVALAIALAIALFARREAHHEPAFVGTPLDPPKTARDFVLRDGAGRNAHVVDRAYPATFLFFGYTHCPDACPLALAALGHAYRQLSPQQAARTRIVFVTVDPVRDTPSVMQRYVRNFDPHIVALTGTPETLARAWDAYGVRVNPQTHEIAHGDAIYAIDLSGRVRLIYPADTSAKDYATDMATLAR